MAVTDVERRQGLVIAYPVEILPYELRAKGLQLTFFGISSNGTLQKDTALTALHSLTITVVNQYINPVGLQNEGWKFYIVSASEKWY